MGDDPEREKGDDEKDEEKRPRIIRRFVMRGSKLVEVSAAPARETR